jgi:hypothetical protein
MSTGTSKTNGGSTHRQGQPWRDGENAEEKRASASAEHRHTTNSRTYSNQLKGSGRTPIVLPEPLFAGQRENGSRTAKASEPQA